MIESGEIVSLDGSSDRAVRVVSTGLLASRAGWERLAETVRGHLGGFHRAFSLRLGMPKEELRTRLGFDARTFSRVVARLLADEQVREHGPLLALPEHEVRLTPEMERRIDRLLGELRAAGASPPGRQELEARHGVTPEETGVLISRGTLIEIAGDLIYPSDLLDRIVEQVVAAIRESGKMTVAGVRDLTGTSRKYSLALLAYLDERRITRRVGDDRVLF
jgi:selenocysteine-specific elongation factor